MGPNRIPKVKIVETSDSESQTSEEASPNGTRQYFNRDTYIRASISSRDASDTDIENNNLVKVGRKNNDLVKVSVNEGGGGGVTNWSNIGQKFAKTT